MSKAKGVMGEDDGYFITFKRIKGGPSLPSSGIKAGVKNLQPCFAVVFPLVTDFRSKVPNEQSSPCLSLVLGKLRVP